MSKPDWYPDPTNHDQLRWWDGENWTNRIATPEKILTYEKTDYRRHGQLKSTDHSFTIEKRFNQISEKLNEAEVRPEEVKVSSVADEEILYGRPAQSRLKTARDKFVKWVKSDNNMSIKKKTVLAVILVISLATTGSILFATYQAENNFGKPTNHELVEMKELLRSSPNVIEARATYVEDRICNEGSTICEPYKITVSGSQNFNELDYVSLVTSIALMKKSKTDVQLCLSDEDLQTEIQKSPEKYAKIIEASSMKETAVDLLDNSACTLYSNSYLQEIADSY